MKRPALLVVIIVSLGFAFAAHDHFLSTPGTCVIDIAGGQTSIGDSGHGGYHKFHDHVHLGAPGTFAFQQAQNPVAVDKFPTVCD